VCEINLKFNCFLKTILNINLLTCINYVLYHNKKKYNRQFNENIVMVAIKFKKILILCNNTVLIELIIQIKKYTEILHR